MRIYIYKRSTFLTGVLFILLVGTVLAAGYTFRTGIPAGATTAEITVVTSYSNGSYTTDTHTVGVNAGGTLSVDTPYSTNSSESGGNINFTDRNNTNISQVGFTSPGNPNCQYNCKRNL